MTIPTSNAFNKIYPLFIEKYETFIPNGEDEDILVKINSIIDYLNKTGKLTNDVVTQWNKTMKWIQDEGINESTALKLDQMFTTGQLSQLVNAEFDSIESSLAEKAKKLSVSVTDFENLVVNKGFLSEDWQPAIQAAIDSLPSSGGEVLFPDKSPTSVYKVRSVFTISNKSNVKLRGTGSSQLQMDVNTSDVIKIYASSFQRNITIENLNIIYPVGSSTTTGSGVVIETSASNVSIQRILIRNMRIDNPGHGVYMSNVPLWFSDFEDIEVTGSYQSGFTLKGDPTIGRFATISLRRCYTNNMTTVNPAFVLKDGYHALLEQCQADYSVKFGDFKVRGLTLRDCGSEAIELDALPDFNAVLDIANESGVDWGVIVENTHFHILGTTSSTQNEKYLIRSFAPLKVKGFRLFGGGGGGSESAWVFPNNVNIIRCDGDFVHEVEGLTYSWASGGKIIAVQGSIIGKNITSKITDRTGVSDVSVSAFRAYQSVSQPLTLNTWTKVLFQTELEDVIGEYDPTTSRFTAKAGGRYLVNASVGLTNNTDGNRVLLSIYKNGADHSWIYDDRVGAAGTSIANDTALMFLATGDYLEVYVNSVGTGQSTDANSMKTFFRATKISN